MKKHFRLNDLKVKSFVTDFDKGEEHMLKGGKPPVSEPSMKVNPFSWACCAPTEPCQ